MIRQRIREFWLSPCREREDFRPWKTMVVTTLLVMAALFVVSPWGKDIPLGWQFLCTLSCGAVTALAEYIHLLVLPRVFPKWFKLESWTYGKEVLSNIFMLFTVAVFTLLLLVFFFHMPVTSKALLSFFFYFLAIVPLPTGLIYMLKHNRMLTRNLREANEMNEILLKRIAVEDMKNECQDDAPQMITVSDGKSDNFSVSKNNFLYAQANGNYVSVAFLDGPTVAKRLIRTTLKSLEQQYAGNGWVVRCHRAYLVNANRIKMVTGNAQECLLHLEGCPEPVPVSRGCRNEVMKCVQ